MWVFTDTGFVSAVLDKNDSDFLVVRSRDRKSIDDLAHHVGVDVVVGAGTDYPYRVFVRHADFTEWVAQKAMDIDYTNYKSLMVESRPRDLEFLEALHDVWAAMLATEDTKGRNGHLRVI